MTHICVGKLTIIGLDNGLSPGRRQAIIQTNAGILLIGPLGTNLSEILSEIHTLYIFVQENSFETVVWKMAAILSWPQCVNVSWPPRNTFQLNVILNSDIFILENMIENIVCKMAAISFRPECVHSGAICLLHSPFQHTEAKTTWPPFCRQHFKIHFRECRSSYFDSFQFH